MMITESEKKDADRFYNNLCSNASWNGILNSNQTNYLLQNRPDIVICWGKTRKIAIDAITNDSFKLYTKPL